VLEDPVKLARFAGFVNAADAVDDNLQYVGERGQVRPATDADRESGVELVDSERRPVLVAGPTIPIGGAR
jgi:nitrite reductase (NADH) large subunit